MKKHRSLLALAVLAVLAGSARGDGLLLNDGRRYSGKVAEKPDGYEVTVDGQVLSFAKDEVKRWIKSPKDVLGDADAQFEEAKRIYQEAVGIADDKAAEGKFKEALPKVQKARDAYAEARDLFPDGHADLDTQLVNIMKLMRLVRERIGSQFASGGAPAPVKVKDAPPPVRPTVKTAPPPVVELPPAAAAPLPMAEALAVWVDPKRRADAAQRGQAREEFKKHLASGLPLADVARAGFLFLGKPDEDWGLVSDVVEVKGGGSPGSFRGRLDKRSDAVSILVQADGRELKLRTAADGTYVTPPGGSESKASEVKVLGDQPSEPFTALQAVFQALDAARLESVADKELSEAVKILALKVKEFRTKNLPAEALSIVVAGLASALVGKNGGKATPDLEAAFKDLGFEKSDAAAIWGRKEGLAIDDYRKWLASGEYGMALVQFQSEYRGVPDLGVRYATGLLHVFKALTDNRNYGRAAAYFEGAARDVAGPPKDHFLALAKSIRAESPCYACGGTHKINCSVCKGKGRANFECGGCGGSGKVNTFNGVKPCKVCMGKGRYTNEPCPKCKTTGKTECKARGCEREVPKPTFETFADAFACLTCQGRGSLMRHVALPCGDCTGVGLVLQPKSDPAKLLK
jgi:hypothetical protein